MILKIKLGNKTHTATSIVSSITREAMKINRDLLEIAKSEGTYVQAAEDKNFDSLTDMMEKLIEIKDRKAALIVKTYGDKFDIDTLLDNTTDAEIDEQINLLTNGISGIISKK